MKVKLKPKVAPPYALTAGNVYRVIGIEGDSLRIMDDHGEPVLYPPKLFLVVDDTPGVEWSIQLGDAGEMYAYPPGLGEVGFFEDYFDGKEQPRKIVQAYLRKLTDTENSRERLASKRQRKGSKSRRVN